MAGSSIDSTVPTLTRLVRAAALLAAQGASIGFGLNTVRLWSTLNEFAATNKMAASARTTILAWLIAPAAIWVALAFLIALSRPGFSRRLASLEHIAQRCSWLICIGLLPVLFHESVWKPRSLMFLIFTGSATLVAWWSIRVTQKGQVRRHVVDSGTSQLERVAEYVALIVPPKVRVLAPLFVIAAMVLFIVTRGVWFDPLATPLRPSSGSQVAVHSLRQAFVVLGHGGWLGIPIAAVKVLHPPGQAHIVLWAICVSSAAFPLYLWVKHRLGAKIALILALVYLTMPMLRTIGRAEVFPLGIAAGLFFWAMLEWERNAIKSALVLTVLTVGVHEQAALWFACLGVYHATTQKGILHGRWLALLSVAYFALMAFVVLPYVGYDPYNDGFRGMWGRESTGLLGTFQVATTNPAYVVVKWLELQGLAFWLAMFVPFAFLPIIGRRWMLWAVPGLLFGIVGPGRAPTLPMNAGALMHFVVLGFTASVITLARLRGAPQTRSHANAALIAWCFALAPSAYQLGGLWIPVP